MAAARMARRRASRVAAKRRPAPRANAPRRRLDAFTFDGRDATLISANVQAIEYRHRLAIHRGTYRHDFEDKGVELWGLPNGALLIRHPRLPLWEDRLVEDSE